MAFPLSKQEHEAIKARIDGQPEMIVAAAIRHDGAVILFERPGRHGNVLNWLSHHGISRDSRDHGFVTNRGRFVDRAEAGRIVLAAEQGSPGGTPETNPHMHLFSEDMWNDDGWDDEPVDPTTIFGQPLPQPPNPQEGR